ncbi:threonine--tRNA ligase [candidate division WOR-1 bacterium RIFOXYC2_FULL_37_10]|uniref:Threonine--tRNA ligase n=1 Tax=candidate division WOR-1 bacterium RIFOXYB2_FULL_37_13 TaxID=1802579 RepID=A0A1F4SNI9_UNCSA|nr:MAG: threonine--tRNA ligase [candidate division WOR-1 bacterium RIFOXYB2_FULL_37_13]OGC33052.1 MAG: threonine--tRNA ligase [candidate division WOR-1 bacterium RIFOXYC2_FULL_37_10]
MDLEILRHSTSHILAAAVKALYPEARLAIGPAISEGFYYDFDIPDITLSNEDLNKIEDKMREIIKEGYPFEKSEMTKDEAIRFLENRGEKYKIELVKNIPDEKVSFYKTGDLIDLCRGPHISSSKEIKAFKLLHTAGAYWKGIETNPMLQRIYGTAFDNKKDLDEYLQKLAEAEKRDHRKLGRELDLFNIYHEEAGAGLVYYHPKGARLRFLVEDFLRREHLKRGYEFVVIPHIAKINLWDTSGHSGYYRENMYFMEIDKQEYVLKPMNCPGHILIYKSKLHSYRDMPVRFFELGTVYRYERSGVLHGLLRVRGFTQDDAHIFTTPEKLGEEILDVIDFAFQMLKTFGFDYEVFLSTRPDKYVGSDENWEHATEALKAALEKKGVKYEIDPGAGVFYGPKIDVKMKDAIGRLWQGPTIQVDFNLPERFDLNYIAEDGTKKRPVMIHRVVLGSVERFLGALIENYAGAFPLWIAPVQAILLPIADRHLEYANKLKKELEEKELRVQIDSGREKIGHKIREAQLQKIPYMIIVGDKEIESQKLAVRSRKEGDIGAFSVGEFINKLGQEIDSRS